MDVRVIAATNRELKEEVASGRFRRDLFYRLSVFPIVVPPLRERVEDIPRLAAHFVDQSVHRYGRQRLRLGEAAVRMLQTYAWPGNVRELQHVIERAVLLSRGSVLRFDDVLGEPGEMNRAASQSSVEPGNGPDFGGRTTGAARASTSDPRWMATIRLMRPMNNV